MPARTTSKVWDRIYKEMGKILTFNQHVVGQVL